MRACQPGLLWSDLTYSIPACVADAVPAGFLDPPPESLAVFARLWAFLHAHAHPAPAAHRAVLAECGDSGAALWLQCGGGGVRLWLAAISRAFPVMGNSANASLTEGVRWVEASDAALAPVLASLWRLALATPRGESVDKPTLHAALRQALQPTSAGGGGQQQQSRESGLRMLRDVRGAAAERERAQAEANAAAAAGGKGGRKAGRGGKKANTKQKPNERCACGSGRKHKKCCGAPA